MTRFRPCIDLHEGRVKQIVGKTLQEGRSQPQTHFISEKPARYFATLYKQDHLAGGHVIMLGPGNEAVAQKALQAYPGGLQIGGGINPENAQTYLKAGASHVIVTSYLFKEKDIDFDRLALIVKKIGKERLVIDLSCRRVGKSWTVAIQKWQTLSRVKMTHEVLNTLSKYCAEFLIHAVDVEGERRGMDEELIERLGAWCSLPVTYAGGASNINDLNRVNDLSRGKVDLTIGSALDIFGGSVRYKDCVTFNQRRSAS